MLPNFLLIGVQKGGTTSTQFTLRHHPEIFMAPNEIHFFDAHYKKGIDWYKRNFNGKGKIAVGEKTPKYVFLPRAIDRIRRHIPDVKLVLILRDPVTRFFSGLNMELRKSKKNVDQKVFNQYARTKIKMNSSFLKRGFYMDQIEYILTKFPREQLYIAISEHVKENPEEEYNKMFEFLGVKKLQKVPFDTTVHKLPYRNKIPEKIKKRLIKIYKPHNERLFKFLGFRIDSWL